MIKSSLLQKFNQILNERPLIVGTLTGRMDLSKQLEEARLADVDIIEVRLDTFPLEAGHPVLKTIRRLSKKPLLLTLRSSPEGGEKRFQKNLGLKPRKEFIKGLIARGDLLDVEIRAKGLAQQLTKFACARGIPVIHYKA